MIADSQSNEMLTTYRVTIEFENSGVMCETLYKLVREQHREGSIFQELSVDSAHYRIVIECYWSAAVLTEDWLSDMNGQPLYSSITEEVLSVERF